MINSINHTILAGNVGGMSAAQSFAAWATHELQRRYPDAEINIAVERGEGFEPDVIVDTSCDDVMDHLDCIDDVSGFVNQLYDRWIKAGCPEIVAV